jgi:hypothetical protein
MNTACDVAARNLGGDAKGSSVKPARTLEPRAGSTRQQGSVRREVQVFRARRIRHGDEQTACRSVARAYGEPQVAVATDRGVILQS